MAGEIKFNDKAIELSRQKESKPELRFKAQTILEMLSGEKIEFPDCIYSVINDSPENEATNLCRLAESVKAEIEGKRRLYKRVLSRIARDLGFESSVPSNGWPVPVLVADRTPPHGARVLANVNGYGWIPMHYNAECRKWHTDTTSDQQPTHWVAFPPEP